jgi:high-affinity K+ transport system ATPase subunit B
MSGVDLDGGRQIRKGAAAAVMKWVRDNGGHPTEEVGGIVGRHLYRQAARRSSSLRRSTAPRHARWV